MLPPPPRHRVLALDHPAPGTARLVLERRGLSFLPGQYCTLARPGTTAFREYSLVSGPADAALEFLVREVGPVSRALGGLHPGDAVECEGPFGRLFDLSDPEDAADADAGRPAGGGQAAVRALLDALAEQPLLLVATGVGAAPFLSLLRGARLERLGLDYFLLHGVRCAAESYCCGAADPERLVTCLSRDPETAAAPGSFAGRVTDWLGANASALAARWGADWPARARCFLAGSADMVHETWDRLAGLGVSAERIRHEIFF